ncbi:hypothetical protein [Nostoc sp. JL31]|uniref:hypothetical protein n=1 Tax=Nostoc sp. JL31 TaxID=2815395 RepID=UPI0025DF7379|nr:hypothetical protein [Nostoc sp. JL31]
MVRKLYRSAASPIVVLNISKTYLTGVQILFPLAAKPQVMREFIKFKECFGKNPADLAIYDIRTANNCKRSPIITSSDP